MFQKALKTAIQLIFSPDTAWKGIHHQKAEIYKIFLLPLWTLIASAALLGNWLISENGTFEKGLKYAIIEYLVLFISFSVTSYSLNEYIKKTNPEISSIKKTQKFVCYSSSLIYLLNLIIALINDFFFLWLFSVYTFYIVYIGNEIFYNIPAHKRVNFTVITSLFIMGILLIIRYLFSIIISR